MTQFILSSIQTVLIIFWLILIIKHNRKVRFLEQKTLENVETSNINFKATREAINETREFLNNLTNTFDKFVKEQKKANNEFSEFNDSVGDFSEAVANSLIKLEERLNRQGKTIQSVHNKNVTLGAKLKFIETYLNTKLMVDEFSQIFTEQEIDNILKQKEEFKNVFLNDLIADIKNEEEKPKKRKYTKKVKNETV